MPLKEVRQPFFKSFIMQLEYGICSGCAKEGSTEKRLIVNKRHKLCNDHNRIRLDNQRGGEIKKETRNMAKKRFSTSFPYSTKWGFLNEKDMFAHIWENSPHVSTISGKAVQYSPSCFAHILAKGLNKYPHYRLNPENIMLMTAEEHHLTDNGTTEQRGRYEIQYSSANFKRFFDAVIRLKKEYKEQYN